MTSRARKNVSNQRLLLDICHLFQFAQMQKMIWIFCDDSRSEAMERRDAHIMRPRADDILELGTHGLDASVGISDSKNAVCRCISLAQDVGDAKGEDGRFARAGTGDHHNRAINGFHSGALGGVELGVEGLEDEVGGFMGFCFWKISRSFVGHDDIISFFTGIQFFPKAKKDNIVCAIKT